MHIPVMLKEVLDTLSPQNSGIYVDGTFGLGGYSRGILESSKCELYGIDRDPDAVKRGKDMEADFPKRFHMLHGRFGDLATLIPKPVDGIALDLGVSSPQLDQAERGFSFQQDGPLDMRMEQDGPTAADLVNSLPEKELADIIYLYGEERLSRRIAKRIVETRRSERFTSTLQLAELVSKCVPRGKQRIHPATRTFQALRIKVNDELGEVERALEASIKMLKTGGIIVIVSFHSLEDRIVKHFFKQHSKPMSEAPLFERLTKKAMKATDEEARTNPRARSAKLRAAKRLPQEIAS